MWPRVMNRLPLVCCVLSMATALLPGAGGPSSNLAAASALPPRLERYLSPVPLTKSDRTALEAGKPVTGFLDADPSREIAVLGAAWIDASPASYVTAVSDIENFERGRAFRVTKRISTPPRMEDFSALKISDDDLDDLKSCRVGDCDLKLGEAAVERFRAEVDWRRPTARAHAEVVFRELMLEYVAGYLEGGNARLAVYRDDPTPTFVADEFAALLGRMPWVANHWPDLRRYLLDYPRATLPGSSGFLYWQDADFGLKPTIRVSHLVIHERPEETVVASKMLYASHYFWTALEVRVLIPDPARGGFWFLMVNRCRADGLGGFFGRFVRGRVRSGVQKGVLTSMAATKRRLEERAE